MKVLVLGFGKSGRAAKKLLEEEGATVFVYDDKSPSQIPDSVDFAVKSPGFPPDHPVIKALKERGIKVVGEVELAYSYFKGRLIAVTGTNGKSTTTALIHHVLKEAGINSFIGGNFGIPFSSFVKETTKDSVTVLELSSFQIEDLDSFRADIGVILNITPDHLNRYSSFKDYAEAKKKLIYFSKTSVLNYDDEWLRAVRDGKILYFSLNSEKDAYFDGEKIILMGKYSLPVCRLPLKGIHNIENYMASALVLLRLGVDWKFIIKGFETFKGLPHRVEFAGRVGGVVFINDSKSTNVDSLRKALLSFNDVVLIAGGVDKGLDFSPLVPLVREKVKGMVLMGEAAEKMERIFGDVCCVSRAFSMDESVEKAFRLAGDGGTVLFSPGCASFDMFKNFEHRGNVFKKCVERLRGRVEG